MLKYFCDWKNLIIRVFEYGLVHDKYGIGRQLYFCSEIQLKEPHDGGVILKDDNKDVGRKQIA